MVDRLTNEEISKLYMGEFRSYCDEARAAEWRSNYLADVTRAQNASKEEWDQESFQAFLWDRNSVADIGPGRAVTVKGAYADKGISDRLFDLRNSKMPRTLVERGQFLQKAYDEILSLVHGVHNERRPKARIIRLMAVLFPDHMTCLMDEGRVRRVQTLISAHRLATDFVGQHATLRQKIADIVGAPTNAAESVDQAIFSWFLWQRYFKALEDGAVLLDEAPPQANDVPVLNLLPANVQRRGLFCVQDNVNLLVSIAREAETGLARRDLAEFILQEAPQLNESSVGNIISQACRGLGVLDLENGTYKSTELGKELVVSSDPAALLREPLVNRVFGIGHILKMLLDTLDGLSRGEVIRRLVAYVPSWKTDVQASHLISWTRATRMVEFKKVAGVAALTLTDEGEELARVLPDDFEEQWRLQPVFDEDDDAVLGAVVAPTLNIDYSIENILKEGSFQERAWLEAALALLKRKKNLILQGPPGTGKTWLAKRLGYALIGEKDKSRLLPVQFQPSMSYEDFVRGWRPNGTGGLALVDGVFLDAVRAAQADPRPYVLVVEEVNRGNPAQIFGELLTLLETDKRIEEEAVRLAYPRRIDERVFIPPNLFVIGTMNLADRSLAVLDLALRRRFAFLSLAPNLGSGWVEWCKGLGAPDHFVESVRGRIVGLNQKIAGDANLGNQFGVGHSFVTPPVELKEAAEVEWAGWFNDVVETEIEPLLREYWYDNPKAAQEALRDLRFAP